MACVFSFFFFLFFFFFFFFFFFLFFLFLKGKLYDYWKKKKKVFELPFPPWCPVWFFQFFFSYSSFLLFFFFLLWFFCTMFTPITRKTDTHPAMGTDLEQGNEQLLAADSLPLKGIESLEHLVDIQSVRDFLDNIRLDHTCEKR